MPLDPDCLARLKLRQAPFDDVPSEDFLYSDPLLESLIETAARALGSAGAIVILAGAPGSGRSIQLMRLLGTLEGRYELIAFRGRPNIPFDAVDVTIRAHLRAGGFDDPKRTVAELLAERARARARLVLAIDDAHFLGGDSILQLLRMRAEILEAGDQGLRLVLVGDASLSRGRLPLPDPLDDNQVVRLNLRPFNLEQAGAYLRHRLRVAGIEDPDAFLTSGDIAVLQTSSKGIPAALNAQATAWLTRRCRSAGGFKQAVASKLGGLTVPAGASGAPRPTPLGARALPATRIDGEPPEGILDLDPDQEMEPDTYQPSAPPPADPQLSDFLVGEVERADAGDFEQILRRVRQHQQGQGAASVPEPKAATRAELQASAPAAKVAYWNRPWFIPGLLAVVLMATLIPVAIQFLSQSAPPSQPPGTETVAPAASASGQETSADPGEEEPAPMPAPPEPIAPPLDEPAPGDSPPSPDPAESQAADAAAQAPVEPAEQAESAKPVVTAEIQEDLDWLKRQDTERFTIQLVAAGDLAASRAFIAPHGLEGIRFIQTRRYVIGVFGSFPSREQAARMLSDLPKAVRENGPWIRTIGSIRETLP